jgi:sugar phosphate isomerase/epimerase
MGFFNPDLYFSLLDRPYQLAYFTSLHNKEFEMLRRDFVGSGLMGGLTAALARPLWSLEPNLPLVAKNGIGLQLWTVRNQLEQDPKATLKAVSDAGYKQVELMSVLGSDEIVEIAKDLGMNVRSSFINWESVAAPNENTPTIEEIIEKAKEFDLEYLVFGYIGRSARDTGDKLRAIADRANAAAEKVRMAGMKMSYHNHSFEFEKLDKRTGFEILMDGFDEQLINFELDVFWAAIGGWDPVETMKRLGKRVGQVHLKDLKPNMGIIYDEGKVPEDAFQEVGDGIIDMKSIMEVAVANGVQQFHVEQDQSPDPIVSIGQSIGFIEKNLW